MISLKFIILYKKKVKMFIYIDFDLIDLEWVTLRVNIKLNLLS